MAMNLSLEWSRLDYFLILTPCFLPPLLGLYPEVELMTFAFPHSCKLVLEFTAPHSPVWVQQRKAAKVGTQYFSRASGEHQTCKRRRS